MIILVDAEDRENEGDLVIPAQMATPDAINFMAKHGRGLICLSLTRQRADQLRLEYMARAERGEEAHRLHGVDRGARGRGHRHLRARPRPHHRHRHRPHQGPQRHRLAGPRVPADRARGRRAGARRAHGGQRRSRAARRALSRRRHLRDHERRRHHGAHARPRRLRPAPRPQDRHHRGPDRLPARATTASCAGSPRSRLDSAFGGAFDLHVYETTVEPVEHLALVKGDLEAPGPVLVRVHAVQRASPTCWASAPRAPRAR